MPVIILVGGMMRQITLTGVPLPPLKPMGQLRLGVVRVLEAQIRPLIVTIPRFIQLGVPLPPLKPMGQLRRGVVRIVEA
ncbi:hypothetical protein BSPLISOX_253 [uncultured Gammaproteobacteria bacterium]|nr:hypothetical protein BSPLISOX_253 [uncultured Gammaproteobacteria bacterium]